MSDKQYLQNLIKNHTKRLQRLEEQKALEGRSASPELRIEIEEIKETLTNLETELRQLGQETTALAEPFASNADGGGTGALFSVSVVTQILAFYIVRTGPELNKSIGREAASVAGEIYDIVRQYARHVLKAFEEDPERYERALETELLEVFEEFPEARLQVAPLIRRYESLCPPEYRKPIIASPAPDPQATTGRAKAPAEAKTEKLSADADYLQQALRAYVAQIEDKVRASTVKTPDTPYKGLFYFEITDEQIFFGRESQIEQLLKKIGVHRLTVLHGVSGAGKTSLINAGLAPKLLREGLIPLYPMPGVGKQYQDPGAMIVRRLLSAMPFDPTFQHLADMPLYPLLKMACQGANGKTLVIFLDRFEDFFSRQTPEERSPFILELAKCYNDDSLPLRFVISIRKDFFSDLFELERVIPTVFFNQVKLEPLTTAQAHLAIFSPAARIGLQYEKGLTEAILADLGGDIIEPTQLQIVCNRLYEEHTGSLITRTDYERLGRAEGIIAAHLALVMEGLGAHRSVAERVLIELLPVAETKRTLTHADLAHIIQAPALDEVLERLVYYRLLRKDEVAGETHYELVHEYLIDEIKSWISDEQLRLQEVKVLLRRELSNWHIFGTLINPDRLQIIERWVNSGQLLLSDDARELIEASRQKRALDEQEQLQIIQSAKITSLDQLVLGIDHELSSPISCINSNSQWLKGSVEDIQTILLDEMPQQLIEFGQAHKKQLLANFEDSAAAKVQVNRLIDNYFKNLGEQLKAFVKEGGVLDTLEDIQQISDELDESSNKMRHLIPALSNFVQPGDAKFRVTDVHAGLKTALLLLGYELNYHAEVRQNYQADFFEILGSSNQIVQLFMNILMNSVEAIKLNKDEDFSGVITVTTSRNNNTGEVIIADNGVGISPENLGQIFLPGFTTKGGPSHGLGLSIAQQIVRLHKGEIEVLKTGAKKGTTLKVRLPLVNAED